MRRSWRPADEQALRSSPLDAQTAAICLQYDAILATRSTRDFEGVGLKLVDPWTPTAGRS
jgi:predicted nucleic acid-binding protein